MFHKMPEIIPGLGLLQDRVFHVLVVTAHSTYPLKVKPGTPQSFTAQLPIDFASLSDSNSIMKRSHFKKEGSTFRYYLPSDAVTVTEERKKRVGRKLTEGNYVSLERLQQASKDPLPPGEAVVLGPPPIDTVYRHRWDMSKFIRVKCANIFLTMSVLL